MKLAWVVIVIVAAFLALVPTKVQTDHHVESPEDPICWTCDHDATGDVDLGDALVLFAHFGEQHYCQPSGEVAGGETVTLSGPAPITATEVLLSVIGPPTAHEGTFSWYTSDTRTLPVVNQRYDGSPFIRVIDGAINFTVPADYEQGEYIVGVSWTDGVEWWPLPGCTFTVTGPVPPLCIVVPLDGQLSVGEDVTIVQHDGVPGETLEIVVAAEGDQVYEVRGFQAVVDASGHWQSTYVIDESYLPGEYYVTVWRNGRDNFTQNADAELAYGCEYEVTNTASGPS